MRKKVTASDVATEAGVSRTAVSLVVNGREGGNVAPDVAARVREVAAQLGYQPDRLARSLRTQRTHVIGIVTDTITTSPFAGRILAGAVARAESSGYAIIVADSADRRDREQEAVEEFEARSVDGLVYGAMGLRELHAPPTSRLPMTLANCFVDDDRFAAVVPAEVAAGTAAAQHLLDLGHRRISMLSAPGSEPEGNIAAPLRSKGFRAATRSAGLTATDCPIERGGWTIDAGYAAAVRALTTDGTTLRDRADRPTALFTITDRAATGALLAAARLGLDVPGDLSIVGFDDQEELAANLVPALTTMALPHREMGARAIELLLDQLGAASPQPGPVSGATPVAQPKPGLVREELPCPLVVRESTGPAPRR